MSRARFGIPLPDSVAPLLSQDTKDLLARYRSWILAGILGFRSLSAMPSMVILIGMYGARRLVPLIVVWAVLVVASVAALPRVLRYGDPPTSRALPWLLADAAVAVGVNIWGAAVVPGAINEPYQDLYWFWCMGTVMMWTAWFGSRVGTVVVLLSVPLQLVMTWVNGWVPLAGTLSMIVGRTVWLSVGLLGGLLFLATMRVASRGALAEGERAGRQSEQIRMLRELHDTALQTLESIGITASDRRQDAEERLTTVHQAARWQAAELRSALESGVDPEESHLPADPLVELARAVKGAERTMRPLGIEISLTSRKLQGVRIPRYRSDALRNGVREALSNVQRHAAAGSTTVRAVALPDRLEVTVRDDGNGFDPTGTSGGFGIRQSIVARLEEVGGGAEIRSRPQRGTLVRMWVPL